VRREEPQGVGEEYGEEEHDQSGRRYGQDRGRHRAGRGSRRGHQGRRAVGGGAGQRLSRARRSPAVTEACQKHGGFYLGSIGGPAAILAQDSIRKVEVIEYPELGMEASYRIEVVDFPAFVLVDDKGNDFFRRLR